MTPLLLVLPSVVACSGGGNDKPDAFVVVADARPDAPPLPPGCDAQELSDLTNDDFNVGTPEDTGLMFTASSTICGTANTGHYDPPTMAGETGLVDVDSYKISVPADSSVYITLSGAGLEGVKGNFRIYDAAGDPNDPPIMFGEMHNGHTANHIGLPTGSYLFTAIFLADAATTADIKYKIKAVTENADARCAIATTGGYAEASDGAGSVGNDMIKWNYGTAGDVTFTAANDAPENSGITAADAMSYRITGTSANITSAEPATDDYKDHDTFEFTTGPTTNEITIRMKFPTATADLDIALASKPAIGETTVNLLDWSNRLASGPSEELVTSAVEPNTSYWFWVGGYKTYGPAASAIAATASTYDVTICSKAATP